MCGRYATTMDTETLYRVFDAEPEATSLPGTGLYGGDEPRPRYNIAPTTANPVVRERAVDDHHQPVRRIDVLQWGLVPSWAKDPKIGARMFNARAESVGQKPAFRRALGRRRCLVPASGFFEWQKSQGQKSQGKDSSGKLVKQPFFITPSDGSVMAFAGLWEYWRPDEEKDADSAEQIVAEQIDAEPIVAEPIVSYTILTTDAVGAMADVHDRMPLILPAADWDAWLDPARGAESIEALLAPPEEKLVAQLDFRSVSPRVGNVRNDDADLLAPIELPSLFTVPGAGAR